MVKRKTAIALGIALIIGSQLLRREPDEISRPDVRGSGGVFSFLTGEPGKKETTITETTTAGAQPIINIPPVPEAPPGFFDVDPTRPTAPQPTPQFFTSGGTTQQLQASLDALRASLGAPPPAVAVSKKDLSTSSLSGVIPQQTISPFKAPVSRPFGPFRPDPGASRLRASLSAEEATFSTPMVTKKDISTPQFAPTNIQIQSSPSFGRFES